MSLTPAFLDEVRSRTSLSALVARRVKLERAGREFKACCPFHSEKTPSFTVNDDKGMYFCFGCGAGGDAIRWLTDGEGLNFIDAVRQLAEAAGLDMPARDAKSAERAARIDGIRPALDAAAAWYSARLRENADARDYLTARGIDGPVAARFGMGWAPEASGHVQSIPGMTRDAALAAGLIWVDEAAGKSGATFRARLMIPVHDARGRLVGFGGRLLAAAGDAPKYKNSPDSEIFDKGRLLFNAHRAAEMRRAMDAAARRLLIVEGYMDAIALDSAGWPAVAPMGTAITAQQIEAAWRIDAAPILLFDGDAAGQRAARRAAERALPMLTPVNNLRIATCPAGADPDDILRSDGGAEAMAALVAGAVPIHRWLFDAVVSAADGDADDPSRAAMIWQMLDDLAGSITHGELAHEFRGGWRRRFDREVSAARGGNLVMVAGASGPEWSQEVDDVSARALQKAVDFIMERREARREITDDIAAAMAGLKALGFQMKAVRRLIADLEVARKEGDDGRQQVEAAWAAYRQVMGVAGPVLADVLPRIGDDARAAAARVAGKKLRRLDAELAAPDAPRLVRHG